MHRWRAVAALRLIGSGAARLQGSRKQATAARGGGCFSARVISTAQRRLSCIRSFSVFFLFHVVAAVVRCRVVRDAAALRCGAALAAGGLDQATRTAGGGLLLSARNITPHLARLPPLLSQGCAGEGDAAAVATQRHADCYSLSKPAAGRERQPGRQENRTGCRRSSLLPPSALHLTPDSASSACGCASPVACCWALSLLAAPAWSAAPSAPRRALPSVSDVPSAAAARCGLMPCAFLPPLLPVRCMASVLCSNAYAPEREASALTECCRSGSRGLDTPLIKRQQQQQSPATRAGRDHTMTPTASGRRVAHITRVVRG